MNRCSALLLLTALVGFGAIAAEARAADPIADAAVMADSAEPTAEGAAMQAPAPASFHPIVLGAQYTYILQHQSALHSPYSGPLSLDPSGDTQPSNTIGVYGGW